MRNISFVAMAMLLLALFFQKANNPGSGPPEPLPILSNVTGMANATTIANAVASAPPQSILSLSVGFYRVLKSELTDENSQSNQLGFVDLIYTVVAILGPEASQQIITQGSPVRIVTISTESRKDAMVPGDVFRVDPGGIKFVQH